MQRRGTGRQLQRPQSGSTPHDRFTSPQICPSRSLALDRPRQSASRYPPAVANRRTICQARCYPPRIRQRPHRRTTRWTASIQISQLARSTQIPIAPAAPPYVPLSAVSSLGGFRTPAAELAAPSLMRPTSETLHTSGGPAAHLVRSGFPLKAAFGRSKAVRLRARRLTLGGGRLDVSHGPIWVY